MVIKREIMHHVSVLIRIVASVMRSGLQEPVAILKGAIRKANELLVDESKEDESKRGMGTTVVIATIMEDKMIVANVGDSRLYVVGSSMRQVTRDHSLVNEMVRLGEINAAEARIHPDKNIITRAIGASATVEADFFEVDLEKDSQILMCTDGLSNMVRDEEIFRIMNGEETLEEKAEILVRTANANGGRDNITVMIIRPFFDEVKEC